jgi:hypothetical protein
VFVEVFNFVRSRANGRTTCGVSPAEGGAIVDFGSISHDFGGLVSRGRRED